VNAGMSIAWLCAFFLAAGAVSPWAQTPTALPQPAAGATQDSANDLLVAVGKSVLVDCARTIERIAVGTGDLAEATAVSPTEILINGKAPGETSLIVWQSGGGRQFFNIKVRTSSSVANDRMDALRRQLRMELPGQTLNVSSEGDFLFLRGTVKQLRDSDRAVQIASTVGKVVNLLYVDVPPAEPQILLRVRFASVDRTITKQLGMNLFSTGATNSIGSITTQQFSPPSLSNIPGTASSPTTAALSSLLNIFIFRPDLNLGATIAALQTQGVLQILAEPNVLTANGKQGSFLAGGEYPYPVVQGVTGSGAGAITIQFKEFGVRLDFIPTITPRGTIHLQVAPEVSSLDFANGLSISGFTIPSLDTRKVKTEIELSDGQSFAIGGLLDNRTTKNFSKIPFIGDVPVLGKFFQSQSTTRTNTELIVIVTPEIVAPIPAGAPLPELKFSDKFLLPTSRDATSAASGRIAGATTTPPRPPIPVEQLIQSLQPEQPLVINSTSPGAFYTTGSQTGGGGAAPSAPPPPQ
jgi:pilus assembly protein CpaC